MSRTAIAIVAAAAVLVAALVVVADRLVGPSTDRSAGDVAQPGDDDVASRPDAGRDDLHRATLDELQVFVDWLEEHGVEGYIGEVGWPAGADTRSWNDLAAAWFDRADRADLWVSVWATGEWWPDDYPYLFYTSDDEAGPVARPAPQAQILEAHLGNAQVRRGINVAGPEFGAPGSGEQTSPFSNRRPGEEGRDYAYPDPETFVFLASRGLDHVRLPFRWERVQPDLLGPLDEAEVARLLGAVDDAHAAGLGVVLDLHNYGQYWLDDGDQGVRRPVGSPQVSADALADLWTRLSARFRDHEGVLGYGLMNEPTYLADDGTPPGERWEAITQRLVDALRAEGDGSLLFVPGYSWSNVGTWTQHHPEPWIDDPVDNHRYEAHHYWQDDYQASYEQTRASVEPDR